MAQHQITPDGIHKGGFDAEGQWSDEVIQPRYTTEVRIDSGRGYPHRFGVGLVPAGQMATKDSRLVAGPWAYTYGLATVLSAEPMPEPDHVNAEWGDVIILDGMPFVIEPLIRFGKRSPEWATLNPAPGTVVADGRGGWVYSEAHGAVTR